MRTAHRLAKHLLRIGLATALCVAVLGAAAPARAELLPNRTVQLAAGGGHTCARTNVGGVKCWGANAFGQLGDGATTDRLTPVDVSGLSSNIGAIAAGGLHICALTSAGGVKCWGWNLYGQLGDGTTLNRTTPVDVSGLSGVSAIAAGGYHTCALTNAGGVKCWGLNDSGQLGDGTTTRRAAPVNVSGLSSGVRAIATGAKHTCALTNAGGVKCWGLNDLGQLGDGTTTSRATPVDVSGLSSGVLAIATGVAHTCALTGAGGVKCWGRNDFGQLGDTTTTQHITPVDVSGLSGGVSAIATSSNHTCALTNVGGVACWGFNVFGQLGDGTTLNRTTPQYVIGLTSGVLAIAGGGSHTCALTNANAIKCWGSNSAGQLGDGTRLSRLQPTNPLIAGTLALTGGGAHTCALTSAGGVLCWGYNGGGQLGDGTTTQRTTPVGVNGLPNGSGVLAITAGSSHTCAVMDAVHAGGVLCWGYNVHGQLGDGTTTQRTTPVDVSGLSSGVIAITAGNFHTCALTSAGGVKCWGRNSEGELGDGTTTQRTTPVDVSGLSSSVVAIAAGDYHTCALTSAGGVLCWGHNDVGQLGDGTTTNRTTPVDVSGLSSGVLAFMAGNFHTCAVTSAGGVQCWGGNLHGQLGDGTTTQRTTPVDVSGLSSGVVAIATGEEHTCALMDVAHAGGVQCWGWNAYGQLGDGTTTNRLTPVGVSSLSSSLVAIAAGGGHTCALTSAGGVQCWGWNAYGQLGDGTTTDRATPVRIFKDPQWIVFFDPLPNRDVLTPPFTVNVASTLGLPVTLGVGPFSTGVCHVSGHTVTLVAPGLCALFAIQVGNAEVAPVSAFTRSFTVFVGSRVYLPLVLK